MMDTAARGHRVHFVLSQKARETQADEGLIQMRDENKLGRCKQSYAGGKRHGEREEQQGAI